ncbi:MAG: pre-peptidase C-terminal domain-containing protein [Nitrososphaerales archaeon]|uniref:S-layer domain-containing protein n=2 Tax=environmental samples TaxID=651140 RepID=A0A075FRD0_9ARCH|nr:S-layer domain-containing protein [uncultured marine thaumarchaeote AD1000_19_G07]AIE95842.1 S-layer domain-containing protein [uncultured marine thaumarchaeote AD1000_70_G10]
MKNIIQLLMSSLMLFLLISSVFVISFPPVYGAGGSSISNAVELETGKISETWTSGTEYYKVNVLAGQTISINVDLISGTDIDLYLYDPDSSDSEQVQLASSVNGEGIDEIITFTASKSGYYFIKLTGNQWSGLGTYDLNVFITDFDVIFSDWGTQTIPVEVTPGDLGNNLQIVLRNGGDFDINNLSVELILPDVLTNRTGGNILYAISTTTITAGSTNTYNFLVNINEDASIGTLSIPLTINYQTTTGLNGLSIDKDVNVHISGRSFLKLTSSTQLLLPDESNNVEFILLNEGTANTGSIDLSLTIPSPLNLLGSDNKWQLSSLGPDQQTSISISLFAPISAAGNNYQISATMVYDNSFGTTITETRTIFLRVEEVTNKGIAVVDTFWGSPNDQISVEPGDNSVKLNVVIQNRDTGPISGIQGKLISNNYFSSSNGANSMTGFFGATVPSGSTSSADFLVDVSDSIELGEYNLQLDFSYLDKDSLLRNEIIDFSVIIDGKSDIELSIKNNVLTSGTENDLILEISNIGTAPAYSISLSVSYGTSSSILGTSLDDNTRKLDHLLTDEKTSFSFPTYVSPTAQKGLYPISVVVEYRTINGLQKTISQEFGVIVKDWSSPFSINIPDNVLQSGRITTPLINLQNTGDDDVTDISIDLQFSTVQSSVLPIFLNSGSNTWKFNKLNSGDSLTLDPEIFASLSAADTSSVVQVHISYIDSHGFPHEEIRTIGFTIRGLIDLTFKSVEFDREVLPAGFNASIVGNLLNQGNTDAQFLSISILDGDGLILTTESSQYIGEVDADSLIPFSLEFTVDEDARDGTSPLILQVVYEDTYGNKFLHTSTHEFLIGGSLADLQPVIIDEISTTSAFLSSPIAIIGVGAFVILITIFILRRRSSKQPF